MRLWAESRARAKKKKEKKMGQGRRATRTRQLAATAAEIDAQAESANANSTRKKTRLGTREKMGEKNCTGMHLMTKKTCMHVKSRVKVPTLVGANRHAQG